MIKAMTVQVNQCHHLLTTIAFSRPDYQPPDFTCVRYRTDTVVSNTTVLCHSFNCSCRLRYNIHVRLEVTRMKMHFMHLMLRAVHVILIVQNIEMVTNMTV